MHARTLVLQAWDPDDAVFPHVCCVIPALSEIPPLEALVGDRSAEVSVLLPAATQQRDCAPSPSSCVVSSTPHVVQELALDMDFPIVWGPFATQRSAQAFADLRVAARLRESAELPMDDVERILTALDHHELVRTAQLQRLE